MLMIACSGMALVLTWGCLYDLDIGLSTAKISQPEGGGSF